MTTLPKSVAAFLEGKRIAVAGVSREPHQPANAIFKRLVSSGHEVFAVNPKATEIENTTCYPDLASIPGELDGVVIATHPAVSVEIVRQCATEGVGRVWFHRSFGDGSVSDEALRECEEKGIDPIVGGCPMMFCGSVDIAHKCMRWWLQRRGRVPQA